MDRRDNNVVRGIGFTSISAFAQYGIILRGSNSTITGCYFGTNAAVLE